jgi:hypothetical protein
VPKSKAESAREWYQRHRERILAAARARYALDPETKRRRSRESYRSDPVAGRERVALYVANNRESVLRKKREESKRFRRDHPALSHARTKAVRLKRRQRVPGWADSARIEAVYEVASAWRRSGFEVEVDHVIPLNGRDVSGLHVADNLDVVWKSANRSKGNRQATRK